MVFKVRRVISFWEEGGNSDWERAEMSYPISWPIGITWCVCFVITH